MEKQNQKYFDILNSALNEFSIKSYKEASLNEILKNSKISKGVFYYYFKSKSDLYVTLISNSVEVKWKFINECIKDDNVAVDNIDIFETLKIQVKYGMLFAKKHPKYYKLGKKFSEEKNTKIYETVSDKLNLSGENIIETLVLNSFENNVFDEQFDKEFISKMISFHFKNFDEIFENSDIDTIEEETDQLIMFLKRGFCKQ